jgi:YbbR domain-containing protein
MRVPIEFTLPDDIVIDSGTFTQAQVRVRGPERLIHRLEPGDVHAEVDLGHIQPGERTFDLTGHVHVPQDLSVVQIIPSQFHLSFENRDTRTVGVHPRVTGNLASGMRVVADPSKIMITGPRRRVEAVDTVSTDPVDISGTTPGNTFLTQVYVSDPLIQVVHPIPIRVTVIMDGAGSKQAK